MKEFNLSDKEIKALLQEEGLEEPSLSFDRIILEKAELSKGHGVLTVPLWIKLVFALLILSPICYALIDGNGFNLGLSNWGFDPLNFKRPEFSLDVSLSSTYQYISLLVVAVIWMAVLFNKYLNQQSQHKVKNG